MTAPTSLHECAALYGVATLGDAEILALVMRSPVSDAAAVIEACGGIIALANGDYQATPARRAAIGAAVELSRRIARAELPYRTTLRGPDDVARFARSQWGDSACERFALIGLDARSRVMLVRDVALGSLAHVDVHPREVFGPLVRAAAHSCIVIHNHPSGEPEPSQADIDLTRRLVDVGRLLGVPVLDHLIVTRTRSVSLAGLGMVGAA